METKNEPLIVDKKTRRFWALIDADGTMACDTVHAEFSPRNGHDEISIFTSLEIAKRAAAAQKLDNDWDLTPVEVTIARSAS